MVVPPSPPRQTAGEVTWAIDLAAGGADLSITLLLEASQRLLCIPGRSVSITLLRADVRDRARQPHTSRMCRAQSSCTLRARCAEQID